MKKSKKPLVSIVVPVYNVEPYLLRCVESMINQSYQNIEILLVDDGSRDGSGKIVDECSDLDDRVVAIHQQNAGVSVARNVGIDRAQGEYVTFADPDDYLEHGAIQDMVDAMLAHDVDVVRTRCNTYRNNRKIDSDFGIDVGEYRGEKLRRLAYRSALHRADDAISCCWLILVKKSVLDTYDIRFTEGMIIMQDVWFYVDLLCRVESLYAAPSVTYNYMINSTGTISSKAKFVEKVGCIVRLYQHTATVWPEGEESDGLRDQYGVLVATRAINSATLSRREIERLLVAVQPYKKDLIGKVRVRKFGVRHRLYVRAIRDDNVLLVAALVAARRIAILAKG